MSPKILYCMEDETVADVLLNMREEQIRRLPVVNGQKRLVGVVSLGDLSRAEAHRRATHLQESLNPCSPDWPRNFGFFL